MRGAFVDQGRLFSYTSPEARVPAQGWKRGYNQVRPHGSLGYRTPAEFGGSCPRADSASLRRPGGTTATVDPTLTAPGT